MEPTFDSYPQFVANQVLKKDHLNELFGYLDEQNRLTRTNLIGIGIVCGLDVIPDASINTITFTQGCGVTSEGYLVAADTVALTHYQVYEVPQKVIYPPLYDSATQKNKYPLWEMLPAGGTQALDATFWADKVVLIFVELKEENLKNCSPNSCDDRGVEVTVTFRYLLISLTDADNLRADLLDNTDDATDLNQLTQAKALLKEIRLKRFDVPRQTPPLLTTNDLFDAYRKILTKQSIETFRDELMQAYTIYKPLLGSLPDTVLQNFGSTFTYQSDQLTLSNPLEYQYYYDFISDLIEAYNELRTVGLYAISICCPPPGLFPRHLLLGKATEDTTQVTSQYRHYFLPSPLFGSQKAVANQIQQLFERIIRLIEAFAIPHPKTLFDFNAIRITPSSLGPVPLSQKAIPFYYQITNGAPPLYQLWNYAKSQENKAKTNLTYHADLYPAPVEDFVLKPLTYDLEPYNFFRIEGHIGLHWFYALWRLAALRSQNRLPFDIVVLKTGRNFTNILDWHTHQCYFQDLEALFASLKEELICLLCQEARYFYDIPLSRGKTGQRLPTKVDFLRHCDPGYTYLENTWGFLYENAFEKTDLFKLFNRWQRLAADQNTKDFLLLIHKIIELGDLLTEAKDLVNFNIELFRAKHTDLSEYAALRLAELKLLLPQQNSDELSNAWLVEDLIDHLDFIIHACKAEAFEALAETCRKRREALQQQLLWGNYNRKNPGINHKSGVPVGGTFLLVYAGEEDTPTPPQKGRFIIAGRVVDNSGAPVPGVNILVRNTTQGTITQVDGRFRLIVTQLPVTLVVAFVGIPSQEVTVKEATDTLTIIVGEELPATNGQNRLPNGIVIADFYLPYLCCSDCLPIQINIPEPKPDEPEPLRVKPGEPECDEEKKNFTVILTISGGTPPYSVNGQPVNGADGKTHAVTLPTNQGDALVVTDDASQQVTVTINPHDCQPAEPCDLPCAGKAEKCLYPLWVPKPSRERRIRTREIKETILLIKDLENNKEFTIDFRELYEATVGELDNQTFDERFTKFVAELTSLVAQQMGADIFMITYDPKLRMLAFEHYTCHTFEMRVEVRLLFGDNQFPVIAHYNQDGWTLTDQEFNQTVTGRKVGCILMDKCKNITKPVCDEIIKPDAITIFVDMNENQVKYNLLNEDGLQPGLWMFENGGPFISQSFSGEYNGFASLEEDSVWVLGLKDNCFGVDTEFITNA
ncbi:carboxypeptidase-like regulatory domain-containing protein [Adhaeribacter rhizoryzae]|uniref:Carboxypeptidase regulatory-like domain-containing protein n=1 Tax=Adhaeribacter rhizoryzae TaxID=2607907 RepID=A0A5M6DLM3_9BACT|nr:carboxypeptidase-like regulatory domain-containing protein [Adhaeribacter rhizoryzae]KAA5548438.1 hypothetical protein F0145_06850 [Adhaeribacter rhizoryzae]